jgi:hypothetical protein
MLLKNREHFRMIKNGGRGMILIEHDYYKIQAEADIERDNLRAEGFQTQTEKRICEELEEAALRG